MTSLAYALPSMVGTVTSLLLGVYMAIRRPGPAWRYLAATGIAGAWWCAGQWAWVLADDPATRFRVAQLQYLAIATYPVLWLHVGLVYAGRRRWLRPWPGLLLWMVPAVTIILAATNSLHGLVWQSFDPVPGAARVALRYGPWFNVHSAYSYGVVLVGTILMAIRFAASPLYLRSFLIVILGPTLVMVANIVHLTAKDLLPLDPTPSAFAVAFALIAWTIRRDRFLSLVPLARGVTLESLHEGVVVLDPQDRIIDVNPAARSLLGPLELGSSLASVLPAGTLLDPGPGREVRLASGRRLDLGVTPVSAGEDAAHGRVVLLRDVTEERESQERLLRAQEELREVNRELERLAHTDTLTGLANRRRLMARLEEEWSRARRHGRALAVVLVDLDHFKRINDTHGHLAGDRVLEEVGRLIQAEVRPEDLAARYGGEELAVLLPETDAGGAGGFLIRLCRRLGALKHSLGHGASFGVTASIGVAALRDDDRSPSDLLARADAALYHVKETGRDGAGVADLGGPRRLDL